jgi:hypothetical protein
MVLSSAYKYFKHYLNLKTNLRFLTIAIEMKNQI